MITFYSKINEIALATNGEMNGLVLTVAAGWRRNLPHLYCHTTNKNFGDNCKHGQQQLVFIFWDRITKFWAKNKNDYSKRNNQAAERNEFIF